MKYLVLVEDRTPGVPMYMSYCDENSIRYDQKITGALAFDSVTTARDAIGQASDFRSRCTYKMITMSDIEFFNMKLKGRIIK